MDADARFRKVHFSLGPVQGFVAAARRTRDLWVGSYLLSYLTGCAMDFVLQHGGSIVFPYVHEPFDPGEPAVEPVIVDPLLKGIQEVRKNGTLPPQAERPLVGSLPNRFVALLPVTLDPQAVAEAIRKRWRHIAEHVYERYVLKAINDPQEEQRVRQLWDRQVNHFWDITWVEQTSENRPVLELRKSWRTHVPTVEPGYKCTVMTNLQELSGYDGPAGAEQRRQLTTFWNRLRTEAEIHPLDLEENERLSAVAFVKRFFPYVAKVAIGWTVDLSYPSTVDIAAFPWVEKVLKSVEDRESAEEFSRLADAIPHVRYKERRVGDQHVESDFARLEGNVFYADFLANDLIWPENTREARERLQKALEPLYEKFGSPSPYYAVLLMDGDSMRKVLSVLGAEKISRALADFTKTVRDIVKKHDGQLVYAGGDDVLALLPLPRALSAAGALRQAYLDSMRRRFPDDALAGANDDGVSAPRPSISAAIVYAHCKAPLRNVLSEAHRLLDEEAKDRVGRDALAVGVWQTHGMRLLWATPWEVPLPEADKSGGTEGPSPGKPITRHVVEIVESLLKDQKSDAQDVVKFTNRFFYKLRDLLAMHHDKLPQGATHAVESSLVPLLVAEYMATRDDGKKESDGRAESVDLDRIEAKVKDMLLLTQQFGRTDETKPHAPLAELKAEGPSVVRFLAREEVS